MDFHQQALTYLTSSRQFPEADDDFLELTDRLDCEVKVDAVNLLDKSRTFLTP